MDRRGMDAGGRSLTISFKDQDEGAIMDLVQSVQNEMMLGDAGERFGRGERDGIGSCGFHTTSETVGLFGMAKGLEWRERKLRNIQREIGRRLNSDLGERRREAESMAADHLRERLGDLERRKEKLERKKTELERKKVDLWRRKSDFAKVIAERRVRSEGELKRTRDELEAKKLRDIQRIQNNEDEQLKRLISSEESLRIAEGTHRNKMEEYRRAKEADILKIDEDHEKRIMGMMSDGGNMNGKLETLRRELEEKRKEAEAMVQSAYEETKKIAHVLSSKEARIKSEHSEKLRASDEEHSRTIKDTEHRINKERMGMETDFQNAMSALKERADDAWFQLYEKTKWDDEKKSKKNRDRGSRSHNSGGSGRDTKSDHRPPRETYAREGTGFQREGLDQHAGESYTGNSRPPQVNSNNTARVRSTQEQDNPYSNRDVCGVHGSGPRPSTQRNDARYDSTTAHYGEGTAAPYETTGRVIGLRRGGNPSGHFCDVTACKHDRRDEMSGERRDSGWTCGSCGRHVGTECHSWCPEDDDTSGSYEDAREAEVEKDVHPESPRVYGERGGGAGVQDTPGVWQGTPRIGGTTLGNGMFPSMKGKPLSDSMSDVD